MMALFKLRNADRSIDVWMFGSDKAHVAIPKNTSLMNASEKLGEGPYCHIGVAFQFFG